MNTEEFISTKKGAQVNAILAQNIALMIEKSEQKRPAAEAVGPIIAEAVGDLTDHEKKLVGRLIKQAIAPHGWQPWKQKRLSKNHFFTAAKVYRRFDAEPPLSSENGAPLGSGASRLAKVQQLVAKLPQRVLSSEDLMAERRAEMAKA